jgi:hypothetical protein
MKRLICSFLIISFFSVGCGRFVEGLEESPNSPTDVGVTLLLPACELGLQTSYVSALARNSSVFVQQLAGTKDQMLEVADYTLLEGDNTNDWNLIYTNIVQTSNDIILKSEKTSPYYAGIAKIIKAMGLGLAADMWGDVPASEAGYAKQNGNMTPKYEVQANVIIYIQKLLDEGLTSLSVSADKNVALPGEDDFLFKGNIVQWKNVAYFLKARYANRLSKKDPLGSATIVLDNLSKIVGFSNLSARYGSNPAENNQWFAFENSRADYLKMGKFMIDKLISLDDPRLPFYALKNEDGIYKGSPANSPDLSASKIGPYIVNPSVSINILTEAELLFLKSEANFRLNKKDLAASNYNEAVKSAIRMVTNQDPSSSYLTTNCSETDMTITLEKIMNQKYLALFVNVEAWSDWRRTGFPSLIPNSNASVQGIPRRYPTVLDERNYNPNAIVISDILKPVWWDSAAN